MTAFERFLIDIDDWPWMALWRVALGLGALPVFRALTGDRDSVWISLTLFISLLITLRVGFAVLRHILQFSAEAKQTWKERRMLAKRCDSYQWQKLFWIGLGLLPYAFVGKGLSNGEVAVMLFCLIGGSLGLLFWYRVNAAVSIR